MCRPLSLFLWLFALLPLAASALPAEVPPQQLLARQWTVADGLPQSTVRALAEDAAGRLWLGSRDGVVRWDGYAFVPLPAADSALPLGAALAIANDGTLWVGSARGLARVAADGRLAIATGGAEPGAVHALLADPDGGVWVGAERGLFHADRDALTPVAPVPTRPVVALALAADRQPVAALADQLWRRGVSGAWHQLALPGFDGLRSLARGSTPGDVWLWVGGEQGLLGVDADGRIRRRPLQRIDVEALALDRDDTLWIGTDDGLWRMPNGELPRRAALPGLDRGHWIRSLHEDRDGNLWLGTHIDGLWRLRLDPLRPFSSADGLPDGDVWSLYREPGGRLWAGTDAGLFVGGAGGFRRALPVDALPDPIVLATLRGRDGTLWLGTRTGLARLAPDSERPRPLPGVDGAVYSLAEDRAGRLWIGGVGGLQQLADGRPSTIGEDAGLPAGVVVRAILPASDGRLWLGTEHGAWRQQADGRFAPVAPASGLAGHRVQMIAEGRPGEVLLALQGGLARSTLAGADVRILGRDAGLHTDTVMWLGIGADQRLWYTSHDGIGALPLPDFDQWLAGTRPRVQPQVFGAAGAARLAQCNGGHAGAGVLVDGRRLWCPARDGVLLLDLMQLQQPPALPVPVIEAVQAGAQTLAPTRAGEVELPLGVRTLRIDVAGIHLGNPDAVRYRARLLGVDQAPRALGRQRSVSYTDLPPGDYRFELSARLADVDAALPPARLTLTVPPFWYESRHWQAALTLALLALLLAGDRWRRARRRAAQARREAPTDPPGHDPDAPTDDDPIAAQRADPDRHRSPHATA